MRRGDAFPSQYLSKEDLVVPAVATIADVQQGEIQGDVGTERKPVMTFQEQGIKPMILNWTNWTTIEMAYGEDTDDWKGHKVELYVDPTVMFGAKRVGGVRVRVPSTLTWLEALSQAEAVGLSKDGLVAALKAHGREGYSAKKDTELVRSIIATAGQASDAPARDDFDAPDDSIPF